MKNQITKIIYFFITILSIFFYITIFFIGSNLLIKINNMREFKIENIIHKFGVIEVDIVGINREIWIYNGMKNNENFIIIRFRFNNPEAVVKIKKIEIEQHKLKKKIEIRDIEEFKLYKDFVFSSNDFISDNNNIIIYLNYEVITNGKIEIMNDTVLAKYYRNVYLTCPIWDTISGF